MVHNSICHFLFVVLWNQAAVSNGFRDIQRRKSPITYTVLARGRKTLLDRSIDNAMVDMTLIRPLNEGQRHSFWYQSISHTRLPIGCQQ